MSERPLLMVADDDYGFASQLIHVAERSGVFDTMPPVCDAAMVYEKTVENMPDVLVLDIFMPETDGIAMLERLNKEGLTGKVSVVLTAPVLDELFLKLIQEKGGRHMILKPMEASLILKNIIYLISSGDDAAGMQAALDKLSAAENDVVTDMIVTRLRLLGIPVHMDGYRYLITAVGRCVEKYDLNIDLANDVYLHTAAVYGTTGQRVERSIRHAIEKAWTSGSIEAQHRIFGYTVNEQKGKPTNKEFITLIADDIVIQLRRKAVGPGYI